MKKFSRKEYKMRAAGEAGGSIEVTLPKEVITRGAEIAGLSVAEFLKNYVAVAIFDDTEGVLYRFERARTEELLPDNYLTSKRKK